MSSSTPAGGPFKAAVGLHEPLNASLIAQARRTLANYCLHPSHDDLCREAMKIMREASRLVAKARLEDLLFNDKYHGADRRFFTIIEGALEFYSQIIGGFIAVYGDKPLVRVKAPIGLSGASLEPGEIAMLPLGEAAILASLGIVEPVESNLLKSTTVQRAGGGDAPSKGGEG